MCRECGVIMENMIILSEEGNCVTDVVVEFNRSRVIYKEGDYNNLENLPSINDTILMGNKSSSELKLLGELHKYDTYLEFPSIPDSNYVNDIFLDVSENMIYRWDSQNLKYYCIGSDYRNIEVINGGKAIWHKDN